MFDLAGRVALVTGAGGNLGLAVARAFQGAGARTILVDRAPDRLAREFPNLKGSAEHVLAGGIDIIAPGTLDGVVAGAVERFGRVDVLVNAAGGFRAGERAHETSPETWELLLDLNLRTSLAGVRAVVPAMLRQRYGKIVLVAARAALAGAANMAAYSASKAAVVRLTESLAAELRHDGINANCVLPGTMDTPQNRSDSPNADFGTWVPPDAVADVILFLSSDLARGVHGAAVPVVGLS